MNDYELNRVTGGKANYSVLAIIGGLITFGLEALSIGSVLMLYQDLLIQYLSLVEQLDHLYVEECQETCVKFTKY